MSILRPALAASLTAVACLSAAGVVAMSGPAEPSPAAVPAARADTCSIRPDRVVLRDKAISLAFEVPGSNDWSFVIPTMNAKASSAKPGLTFGPERFTNADAGVHEVDVTRSGASPCVATFRLVRATSLTLGVQKDGATRVLSGRLVRVNLGARTTYGGFVGAKVLLQRQTASRWVTERTVTTRTGGNYSARIEIGKRNWRAVYAGSGTSNLRFSPTRTDPKIVPKPKPKPPASYANCTAAWNAGAAPLRRGQAGYRSALDRDGDGVACEVDPR